MNIRYRRELWKLLCNLEGGAAEIGVAEGYFSAEMLAWPIELPTVYMVDRWTTEPNQAGDASMPQSWHDRNFIAAKQRVSKYGCRAVLLRGESTKVAEQVPNNSLCLVYIDGDHSYEGVMRDIFAWRPKVVPGGFMAFHDFLARQYGVNQAVTEYCQAHGYELHAIPEDKPEDAGAYFKC